MDIEKKDVQPLQSTPGTPSVPVTSQTQEQKRKRRRCIIICSSISGLIFITFIVCLILALTVFKAKKPELTVTSLVLQDLDVSVNPIPIRVSLNLSLALGITIKNPNKVSIKYRRSSASLRYKGRDVGNVPIPPGRIGKDDTEKLNLTLTVFADRLVSDSNLYGDILRGSLPFTTYTRIKAKVRVLLFYIHVTSTSTCDLDIDLQSRRIANQTCHYKNKF